MRQKTRKRYESTRRASLAWKARQRDTGGCLICVNTAAIKRIYQDHQLVEETRMACCYAHVQKHRVWNMKAYRKDSP